MADDAKQAKSSQNKGSGKVGSKQQAPKVHPAVAEKRDNEENAVSPVQPIEVVRNIPEEDNEGAESVTAANKPNLQEDGDVLVPIEDDPAAKDTKKASKESTGSGRKCWNCANHGETTELNKNGVCPVCGFERDKLYNLDIEAEKARERALAGIQY